MADLGEVPTSVAPVIARDMTYQILFEMGFTITPLADFAATAERGSKAATVLAGAFAGKKNQHHVVRVEVFTAPSGVGSVVRLTRTTTGMAAGAIGVSRANQAMDEWMNQLAARLPR